MLQDSLAHEAIVGRMAVHRLDDWNRVVNGAFENITVDGRRDGFEGVLDVHRFGGLDLSRVASSPAVVRRNRPTGGGEPDTFIPRLVDLHQAGRFPFDRLIAFYPMVRINEAIADAEAGRVVKPVVRMARPRRDG